MKPLRPSFMPPISVMRLARFMMLWLATLLAFVLVFHNGRKVVDALAVTRVDNLEVTGTTDATGFITARAGVQLTTPGTGPVLISGAGVPSLPATIGSLYLRTATAQLYQNTDGGTTWVQLGTGGGGGGAMTISISKNATPASVNLSTEGNVDWLYVPNSTSPPAATASGVLHAPVNRGGYLVTSFRWKIGTSGQMTTDARSTTFSSTASDDLKASALSTTLQSVAFNNSSGSTVADQAIFFRVPSRGGTGTRRVRVYGGNRDDTLTVTASASDGSAPPVSVSNVAAGSSMNMYEILFTGPIGTELFVTGQTSAGINSFPNFWCGAVTVEDI